MIVAFGPTSLEPTASKNITSLIRPLRSFDLNK